MRIRDIKLNGVNEPRGFDLSQMVLSWKVDETQSKSQEYSKIELFKAGQVCWEKEGILDSACEKIPYTLEPRTDYEIKITVTGSNGDTSKEEMSFSTGKMKEVWDAEWIGTRKADTFHPVLFKDFQLHNTIEEVADAKVYICGLGLFEAYVNGQKAGNEYLAPYYNNYKYKQQVMTYDVTGVLRNENRLSIYLGNGWYKGRFAITEEKIYGDEFAAIAELHIRYKDGSSEVIKTDHTWKYKGSDIEYSDIYNGEKLNRLLWKTEDGNRINEEKQVRVLEMKKDNLTDRYSLPVIRKEILPVKEVLHTPAGEVVLDMGQNFTGWIEFSGRQKKGAVITLDFGEVLQDGNFYNDNYRTAESRFIYVSDGREETVRPHFTYFGFRYVRVSGWEGRLNPADFKGWVLYSDLERTGDFKSDNPKLNRLFENSVWGMKSNFLDMPTDCPQRDERLGWTGDAQVFAPTASFHMDTRTFFNKFLWDLNFYQKEMEGGIPVCIPEAANGGHHMTSSVWSDIATFLPSLLYEVYEDIVALKRFYPMMKEWVEYIRKGCQKRGESHNLWNFGFHFGDWLALDGKDEQSCKGQTEEFFIASVYYYQSTRLTAEAAGILEKEDSVSEEERERYRCENEVYTELSRNIYNAVLKEYFTPGGRLAIHTQTAYIICLKFGIYRDKQKIINQFKKKLKEDDFKIQCGFVGAPLLCSVLCENGMEDIAYHFLLNEEYPGWLYCVNMGATTIWERWNSILPDGKISGTGMNSLNHYCYGSIAQFLYEHAAGIQREAPGYRKVRFAPCINAKLRHVKATYDSVYGNYVSEWRILDNGDVKVHFEVPFNGTATVVLPRYDEVIELTAGTFDLVYTPEFSFLVRFNGESMMKNILDDAEGAAYIMEQAPMIWNMCTMSEEACRNMKLADILGMAQSMLGMEKEEGEKILKGIKQIR